MARPARAQLHVLPCQVVRALEFTATEALVSDLLQLTEDLTTGSGNSSHSDQFSNVEEAQVGDAVVNGQVVEFAVYVLHNRLEVRAALAEVVVEDGVDLWQQDLGLQAQPDGEGWKSLFEVHVADLERLLVLVHHLLGLAPVERSLALRLEHLDEADELALYVLFGVSLLDPLC